MIEHIAPKDNLMARNSDCCYGVRRLTGDTYCNGIATVTSAPTGRAGEKNLILILGTDFLEQI